MTAELEQREDIHPEVLMAIEDAIDQFPLEDRAELETAVSMAIILYDGQRRKSGEAYANHVLRVAARIVNQFGIVDKDLFIAGLFHDTVEDQLPRLAPSGQRSDGFVVLDRAFSPRVSQAVAGVTNSEEYELLTDRAAKNDEYIRHAIQELDASDDSFIVKLADFFDNAMQLHLNESRDDQVYAARKYAPLFDYFIRRLETFEAIAEECRRELIRQIKEQQAKVAELLA